MNSHGETNVAMHVGLRLRERRVRSGVQVFCSLFLVSAAFAGDVALLQVPPPASDLAGSAVARGEATGFTTLPEADQAGAAARRDGDPELNGTVQNITAASQ